MTGYPSPNKGSTPLDYAKYHAALLNTTIQKPEPSQEEIRQCVVNAWYVTEWLDRELDFKTPSLYRTLLSQRDRWKAIAEAPRPRHGFWRRVRNVFFPEGGGR